MINLRFINSDKEHIILKIDTNNKGTRWNTLKEKYNLAIYYGDSLGDFLENSEGITSKEIRNLVDKHFKYFGTKFIVLPNPIYGDFKGAVYNYDYSKPPKEKLYYL